MTDTTTSADSVTSPTTQPLTREQTRERAMWRFARSLERLAGADRREPDRAALVALRSGVGKPPGTTIAMYPYLADHLRGEDDWGARLSFEDETWNANLFIVASLFGLHPTKRPPASDAEQDDEPAAVAKSIGPAADARSGHRYGRPFLASLLPIRTGDKDRDQALDRRVVALLKAGPNALPTLLRQAVGLLDEDAPVDWLQLLRDLNQWDHPDRIVQKRWAAAWWTAPTRNEIASDPNDAAASDLSETGDIAGTD